MINMYMSKIYTSAYVYHRVLRETKRTFVQCSQNASRLVLLLWDTIACTAESALLTDGPPFFAYYLCFYAAVCEVLLISSNTIIVLSRTDILSRYLHSAAKVHMHAH